MWQQAIENAATADFDWRYVCTEALHTRSSPDRFKLLQDCEFRVKNAAYLKPTSPKRKDGSNEKQ